MSGPRLSGSEIKALLYKEIGKPLIGELCGGGKQDGGLWVALATWRGEKTIGAFKVYLDAARFGGFNDYGTGEKGDLIHLIALTQRTDPAGALAWARKRLGLDTASPAVIRTVQRQAQETVKRAADDDAAIARRRRERAFELFRTATPILEDDYFGATKIVRQYLHRRGIHLPNIVGLESREIRAGVIEHWKSAVYRNGHKDSPGHRGPAMICAARDRNGVVTGVHCTWVAADGSGKAMVPNPKLMLGDIAGSVIRLTRGPSNLSVEEANEQKIAGTIATGEGVETVLSFGQAVPEVRVWAAASLSNIGNVPLDLPCVRDAILLRENDWHSRQALEAFDLALERLEGHGKPVAPVASHIGSDFNDLLRSG